MRRLRSILFFLLLVVLFAEIWIGFPISIEVAPPNRRSIVDEAAAGDPQQRMKGVHLVESKEGRRDWELFAESAEAFEGKGLWELQKVKILFYNDKTVEFTVTGERGSIDNVSKDMKVAGHVSTITANGYEIFTDAITYTAAKRLLSSPTQIKMASPKKSGKIQFLVSGDRLDALVDQKEVVIGPNVQATHPLKEGGEAKISSDKAIFRTTDKTARFIDNVNMRVGEITLSSPVAVFNYKDNVDILQSVKFDGGVQMRDVDKFATSDSLRFDPETNNYILSGKPRVVQDQDEVTGDQITFIDGGRKIKVENMKAKVEQNAEQ